MDKLLHRIVKKINHAIRIFEDGGMDPQDEWVTKYERIFSLRIWQDIERAGLTFDYYDPDTSYEEDITAYVNALRKFLPKVELALEEDE